MSGRTTMSVHGGFGNATMQRMHPEIHDETGRYQIRSRIFVQMRSNAEYNATIAIPLTNQTMLPRMITENVKSRPR
jgi:hypothetical protein